MRRDIFGAEVVKVLELIALREHMLVTTPLRCLYVVAVLLTSSEVLVGRCKACKHHRVSWLPRKLRIAAS